VTSLRSALTFLTVIPIPGRIEGLGEAAFPVVGAALGVAGGGAYELVGLSGNRALAAIAAVAVLAILTGGLHLDALADCADGLLGGSTPERRLEIMRDSRVGSFGVISLILVVGAEVAALAGTGSRAGFLDLVMAGVLSRLAVLGLIWKLPYIRPTGLGKLLGDRIDVVLACGVASTLALFGAFLRPSLLQFGATLLIVAVVVAGVGWLARRRIGGATGDVYGAGCEIAQMAALVALTSIHG
ncbi:MAG TPA: adenosylcobinamide-GDP ribazoletransferase, partial [Candidatus Dormibacteraeota bacterium]|nr:adenosylcobinamide-GDP ribazoletransferase [Candidatus Dormibacteraeota bacterium]